MRCQKVQVQLLLCRGEQELLDRPDLHRHVHDCPQCRAVWRSAQEVNLLLDAVPRDLPVEDFTDRILARLRAELPSGEADQMAGVAGRPATGRGLRRLLALRLPSPSWPRLTDWALAMATTFAVFALGFSQVVGNHLALVSQTGPEAVAAVSTWFPRLGWLAVDYAQRLVSSIPTW